jgi:hypothetical protein
MSNFMVELLKAAVIVIWFLLMILLYTIANT